MFIYLIDIIIILLSSNGFCIGEDEQIRKNLYSELDYLIFQQDSRTGQDNESPPVDDSVLFLEMQEIKVGLYKNPLIQTVVLSKDVRFIDERAFSYWGDIKKFDMSASKVEIINRETFIHCTELAEFICNENLKIICRNAFEACIKLHNILNLDNIIEIEAFAFSRCRNLNEIHLNPFIEILHPFSFQCCSTLEAVIIPFKHVNQRFYNFNEDGIVYSGLYKEIYLCPPGRKEVTILDSVIIIKSYAFYTHVFPLKAFYTENVELIEDKAFYGCAGIFYLVLMPKIKHIGFKAFVGCINLESVYIWKLVAFIARNAFKGLENLEVTFYVNQYESTHAENLISKYVFEPSTRVRFMHYQENS